MTISKDATYTTRSGLPVRIYAVGCGSSWPVHGAVLEGDVWKPCSWTIHGETSIGERSWNLLPAPREWKRWVILDSDGPYHRLYYSEAEAMQAADESEEAYDRIIEITIREPREGEA